MHQYRKANRNLQAISWDLYGQKTLSSSRDLNEIRLFTFLLQKYKHGSLNSDTLI